jgi:hypothetical protein
MADVSKLAWTEAEPTQPGWYWFTNPLQFGNFLMIVEVVWHDLPGGSLDVWGDMGADPVGKWPGWWMGPLVVPSLPVEAVKS